MKVRVEEFEFDENVIIEKVKARVANDILNKMNYFKEYNIEGFIKEKVNEIVRANEKEIMQMVANVIAKNVIKTKVVKEIEKMFGEKDE